MKLGHWGQVLLPLRSTNYLIKTPVLGIGNLPPSHWWNQSPKQLLLVPLPLMPPRTCRNQARIDLEVSSLGASSHSV